MKRKLPALAFFLAIALAGGGQAAVSNSGVAFASYEIVVGGGKFCRTELYFGFSKPGGSEVTADEWARFLADEVTPRFPDGFTVVEALGQYQGADKKIVKEKSRMLVLLYPKKDRKLNNPKIEAIREAYKKAFQQESVLRLDMRQTVDVSF